MSATRRQQDMRREMLENDLGSYTVIADEITRQLGLDPPVGRRNVYEWNDRRTANRDGQPFPSPVSENPDARGGREPRLLFSISQCVRWASAGMPGPYGRGWR